MDSRATMLGIDGLLYIPEYISQQHHDKLVETIDAQLWRDDLARRTQHYGYVYDYRARNVDASMRLGDLPPWLQRIALQLSRDCPMPEAPDQAIINEYLPGQGIADHVDCTLCFGDVIVSLTLAAPAMMDLKRDGQTVSVWLEPRSVLVMRGEARYHWTHGIAKRKQDMVKETMVERRRRLSATFRKVNLSMD